MKFTRKKNSMKAHLIKESRGGIITMRCGYKFFKRESACETDSRPPLDMLCENCRRTLGDIR